MPENMLKNIEAQSFRAAGVVEDEHYGDEQLNLLRDRVLLLGGKTEAAVKNATRALIERDSDIARTVKDEDKMLDQLNHEIDRLRIEILESHRPTWHFFRLVLSVAKITTILQR